MEIAQEVQQVVSSSCKVVRKLRIDEFRKSERLQSRVKLNPAVIHKYAEAMKLGVKFPLPIVYNDGVINWLGDGKHRVAAAVQAGMTEIEAEVREGSERDAFVSALSANVANGLPPTNLDKRNAATLLLSDSEWSQWSDKQIAMQCGVSGPFVGTMRKRLNIERSPVKKYERNGKKGEMRTARIGTAKCNKRVAAPMLMLPAPEPAISGSEQNQAVSPFEEAHPVVPILVGTVGEVVGKVTLDPNVASETKSLEKFPDELHFKFDVGAVSRDEAAEKVQWLRNAIVKMAEAYGINNLEFVCNSVLRDTTLSTRSMDAQEVLA